MDKNTVLGFILIAVIFVVFSVLNKPSQEEIEATKRKQDSISLVEKQYEEKRIQEIETKQAESKTEVAQVNTEDLEKKYGSFASAVNGKEKLYTLENDVLKLLISNKGGKIVSAELKNYQTHDSLPLVLFKGDSTVFGLNFFAQRRSIATNELFFNTESESIVSVNSEAKSISFRLYSGESDYIEYLYTLEPGSYMANFDINFSGFNRVVDQNINSLDLNWSMYVPQKEKGRQNELNYTTIFYKHYKDEVEKLNPRSKKEIQEEKIPTKLQWLAYKGQFFSSVLIAEENFDNVLLQSEKLADDDPNLKRFSSEIGIPISMHEQFSVPLKFYFGPNHYATLKEYGDLELQELVNLGGYLSKGINRFVIIPIFNFLGKYISNYGIIILLLTIIIKMGLFPLTFKSYQSQAKMRVLKPQIDEINARIPKDKAMERQQATMNLYKKVGINPMGGCLPMLLQMPILFAMFRFFPTSIELRQESFLWAHDLSTYDSIFEWSATIPIISKFYGNHVSLFTLLMTVTTIFSMKTNSQATTSQQMPGMQGMMYMMPVMFMFVLNNFSAGLTYYYFLANLITLGQNFIFKQMIDEQEILKKLEAKKAKAGNKKSKFQQRLEKMAKERGYNMPKK